MSKFDKNYCADNRNVFFYTQAFLRPNYDSNDLVISNDFSDFIICQGSRHIVSGRSLFDNSNFSPLKSVSNVSFRPTHYRNIQGNETNMLINEKVCILKIIIQFPITISLWACLKFFFIIFSDFTIGANQYPSEQFSEQRNTK